MPRAAPISAISPLDARLRVACVSLCSGVSPLSNRDALVRRINEAATQGAEWIALPECANMCQRDPESAFAAAYAENEDPVVAALSERARQTGCFIHAGSVILRNPTLSSGKPMVNRGLLFAPNGEICARYDKIHLFKSVLGRAGDSKNAENHDESAFFAPGSQAVCVRTRWGGYGMTVCYDLRFPALYRALAQAGAVVLSVPAAFTRITGRAHWQILLRARAIENLCFVLAAAQYGELPDGRACWGHSMIIGPWGEILARANARGDTIFSELDMHAVPKMRARLPSALREQKFSLKSVSCWENSPESSQFMKSERDVRQKTPPARQ